MKFKHVYLVFIAFFFLYSAFHAGRYYQLKRSPYYKPYIMYVEQVTEIDREICQLHDNCMDVLSWDDLCTRADLGLE